MCLQAMDVHITSEKQWHNTFDGKMMIPIPTPPLWIGTFYMYMYAGMYSL